MCEHVQCNFISPQWTKLKVLKERRGWSETHNWLSAYVAWFPGCYTWILVATHGSRRWLSCGLSATFASQTVLLWSNFDASKEKSYRRQPLENRAALHCARIRCISFLKRNSAPRKPTHQHTQLARHHIAELVISHRKQDEEQVVGSHKSRLRIRIAIETRSENGRCLVHEVLNSVVISVEPCG